MKTTPTDCSLNQPEENYMRMESARKQIRIQRNRSSKKTLSRKPKEKKENLIFLKTWNGDRKRGKTNKLIESSKPTFNTDQHSSLHSQKVLSKSGEIQDIHWIATNFKTGVKATEMRIATYFTLRIMVH